MSSGSMKTVLVVDDEFGFAEALASILSDAGFRVFIAVNGRQALDRIREVRPHLVVLDFMMPVLSGAATLEALRGDPVTARLPVIMVSAMRQRALSVPWTCCEMPMPQRIIDAFDFA